ncbi:MAG: creatininase family protein [Steroidobacteraceae bacterium]
MSHALRALLAAGLIFSTAAAFAAERPARDPRDAGGGRCARSVYNCIDTPNPLPRTSEVWIEKMTWMDVRDAMAAGKKTIIIPTGGVEPNGPWVALGKHNYALQTNCAAIARRLGNALCAPIVPFVPEGAFDPPGGHMDTVGTISLRESTFQALLEDIVTSFKVHGFEKIFLIGDSGGNARGMEATARKLNSEWKAAPLVAHLPDYYEYSSVHDFLRRKGVMKEGLVSDNVHDDPAVEIEVMGADPEAVRWKERVKLGLATIDGVSIADKDRVLALAREVAEFRATRTIAAMDQAIANRGGLSPAP